MAFKCPCGGSKSGGAEVCANLYVFGMHYLTGNCRGQAVGMEKVLQGGLQSTKPVGTANDIEALTVLAEMKNQDR